MIRTHSLLRLLTLACIWAFIVIGLGAFTRLVDGGLGCPDWPGCFGYIKPPTDPLLIAKAQLHYPSTPVIQLKAWAEMVHRYFAGGLGLLILFVAGATAQFVKRSGKPKQYIPILFLLLLLAYQPILGLWTVTLKLMPIIVSQHLLAGILIFTTLYGLYIMVKYQEHSAPQPPRALMVAGIFGIALLFLQIALGAWTSTNYAAYSCPDFPACHIHHPWHYDITHAFQLFVSHHFNYEGGLLHDAARKTIHMFHRFGALMISFYWTLLSLVSFFRAKSTLVKKSALWVLILLAAQVALGISNVLFQRPLSVAVLHSVIAALLLASTVRLTYFLSK